MGAVLVGVDARSYFWTPNGYDGLPNVGGSVSTLGIYKSFKVDGDFKRAMVKPSSQILAEKRLTDFDWTLTGEHQVRSGGAVVIGLALTSINFIVQFQDEQFGSYWTAYGGLAKFSYEATGDERKETLTLENVGPVGDTGCSLFYSTNPISISQASQLLSGATPQTVGFSF